MNCPVILVPPATCHVPAILSLCAQPDMTIRSIILNSSVGILSFLSVILLLCCRAPEVRLQACRAAQRNVGQWMAPCSSAVTFGYVTREQRLVVCKIGHALQVEREKNACPFHGVAECACVCVCIPCELSSVYVKGVWCV